MGTNRESNWVNASRVNKVLSILFSFRFIARSLPFDWFIFMIEGERKKSTS